MSAVCVWVGAYACGCGCVCRRTAMTKKSPAPNRGSCRRPSADASEDRTTLAFAPNTFTKCSRIVAGLPSPPCAARRCNQRPHQAKAAWCRGCPLASKQFQRALLGTCPAALRLPELLSQALQLVFHLHGAQQSVASSVRRVVGPNGRRRCHARPAC